MMRFAFITFWVGLAGLSSMAAPQPGSQSHEVLLVVGASGDSDYQTNFVQQIGLWKTISERAGSHLITIGTDESAAPNNDHDQLRQTLAKLSQNGISPLWLVFVGHGTFDGKEAKFNLRGPDVTATELLDWVKPLKRPLIFVDTTSASAPFLNKLSGTNRIIVAATRNGNEQNFARFGLCFAEALSESSSDLDKDGQISVLEAFLAASAKVAEFYQTEGRLATEHALLDDDGNSLGTPADWFRGIIPVKKAQGSVSVDGIRAHQVHLVPSAAELALSPEIRAKRDAIELSIARWREQKPKVPETEYYAQLEQLLLELADVYGEKL